MINQYAECRVLFIIVLSVIMMNAIIVKVIMLSVAMQNVIMLSVLVPFLGLRQIFKNL